MAFSELFVASTQALEQDASDYIFEERSLFAATTLRPNKIWNDEFAPAAKRRRLNDGCSYNIEDSGGSSNIEDDDESEPENLPSPEIFRGALPSPLSPVFSTTMFASSLVRHLSSSLMNIDDINLDESLHGSAEGVLDISMSPNLTPSPSASFHEDKNHNKEIDSFVYSEQPALQSLYQCDSPSVPKGKFLGRGAFGRVIASFVKGRFVAIKEVRKTDDPAEKNALNLIHRHVVRTLNIQQLGIRHFLITMEFGGYRNLENIIDGVPLKFIDTLRYGRQVASALHYIHRQNILHLDVKPANILLHGGDCRLADFGSSVVRGMQRPKVAGTVQYMAPELLRNQPIDYHTDVYSLAMTLWQMTTGCHPFSGMHQHTIMYLVAHQDKRPPLSPALHPAFRDLLVRSWNTIPSQRPTTGAILHVLVSLHKTARLLTRF